MFIIIDAFSCSCAYQGRYSLVCVKGITNKSKGFTFVRSPFPLQTKVLLERTETFVTQALEV